MDSISLIRSKSSYIYTLANQPGNWQAGQLQNAISSFSKSNQLEVLAFR
jgi:hypothetical protein